MSIYEYDCLYVVYNNRNKNSVNIIQIYPLKSIHLASQSLWMAEHKRENVACTRIKHWQLHFLRMSAKRSNYMAARNELFIVNTWVWLAATLSVSLSFFNHSNWLHKWHRIQIYHWKKNLWPYFFLSYDCNAITRQVFKSDLYNYILL